MQRLVLLSSYSVAISPESKIGMYHKRAEDAIKAAGVHYTFIRSGLLNSNFHMFVDTQLARDDGIIDLPYPEAVMAPVAEEDLVAVAILALTTEQLQDDAHIVTGPQAIDMASAVAVISALRAAAGKQPLTVKRLSEDEWVEKYTGVLPVPPFLVKAMAGMWRGLVGKQPHVQSSERLTGKSSTTFEEWAENRRDEWIEADQVLKSVSL